MPPRNDRGRTIVPAWRSAARPTDAFMLVGPDQRAVGSVSGRLYEGAAYELAQQVVADCHPVMRRYGVVTTGC